MLKTILTIVFVLICVALTVIVLLQEGKTAGINGAVGGGSDTFLSKNKAKTWNAKLARWTKWVAIVFIVLTLVICLL